MNIKLMYKEGNKILPIRFLGTGYQSLIGLPINDVLVTYQDSKKQSMLSPAMHTEGILV